MTIGYNEKHNAIAIRFKYDPAIVNAVRSIPGRLYIKEEKMWTVPIWHAAELLSSMEQFKPTYLSDIEVIAEENDLFFSQAKSLKENKHDSFVSKYPLFSFQKTGVKWIEYCERVLLADEPGLGKTLQTIAALEGVKTILVICQATNKYDPWENEIKKWTSSKPLVISGNASNRSIQWKDAPKTKWTICNYELLLRDINTINALKLRFDAIVVDEAQRISNPFAKTTKAIKSLLSDYRIALTGTPVSNSPVDAFSIIDWIRPGYLGTYKQFFNEYVITDNFGNVRSYKNLSKLNTLIEPLFIRRTKQEVFGDFPPLTIQHISFDLSGREKNLYSHIKQCILDEIGGAIDKIDAKTLGLLPVKMLRLKQIADHPKLIGDFNEDSSKLIALKELMATILFNNKNLSTGQIPQKEYTNKVIVFSQFASMCKLLKEAFSDHDPAMIIGDTPLEERANIVKEFNENPFKKVLVMSEAGSAGLNLQAASYIINYDLPWSAGKFEQRIGRAYRIGQKFLVTVYNLIARNTIDEYNLSKLLKKQEISNDILGEERFSRQDAINILS